MDRLTNSNGESIVCEFCKENYFMCGENCDIQVNKLANRLAHYEDLIEQGLMIELPCRVGDTVYSIEYDYYKDGLKVKDVKIKSLIHLMNIGLEEFNEWVFLTREQAEEKLKEMER